MKQEDTLITACPISRLKNDKILLGHGSGGKMTADLIESLFLPHFSTSSEPLHDSAIITVGKTKLAFTTDSYVVQPAFFPGGNIGTLAVNGTINDLAMSGAHPLSLSCGFILEEGFPMEKLKEIVYSMQKAAQAVETRIVTGDTKVVEKGKGDGIYINTSGIGIVGTLSSTPKNISVGDKILVNGDIGCHGTAIMSVREGLTFESEIISDTQELITLVKALEKAAIPVHCMRDLTRGGLATALVELAETSSVGIDIDESKVPVNNIVKGACEFLGLDPYYVACEGRMIAFVPADHSNDALEVMQAFNKESRIIGEVTATMRPQVTSKTFVGTKRLLDRLSGDQLPRIC